MHKLVELLKKYIVFTNVGLLRTVARQIPIAASSGDERECSVVQDIVALLSTIIMSLTVVVLSDRISSPMNRVAFIFKVGLL